MGSYDRKDWEKVRPSEAKDSGTGGAMDVLNKSEKLMAGPVGTGDKLQKTVQDCLTVLGDIEKLRKCLNEGEQRAKTKSEPFKKALDKWRKSMTELQKTTRERGHDACKRICYEAATLEGARLMKQLVTTQNSIRDLGRLEPGARVKQIAVIRSDIKNFELSEKHKPKGMKAFLAKNVDVGIKNGLFTAGDIPDTVEQQELDELLGTIKTELSKVNTFAPARPG